jgi:hypothetical protein
MALAVVTVSGVYLFKTTDTVAAALGLVGLSVFLTAGVLSGVVLTQRGVVFSPKRTSLAALPLLIVVWLYIALRYF